MRRTTIFVGLIALLLGRAVVLEPSLIVTRGVLPLLGLAYRALGPKIPDHELQETPSETFRALRWSFPLPNLEGESWEKFAMEFRGPFAIFAAYPLASDTVLEEVGANPQGARGLWITSGAAATWRQKGVILYTHGGGYYSGTAKAFAHLSEILSRRTGAAVFNVDYPLCPENPFEASLEAVLAAYDYLLKERKVPSNQIFVAGESAGGALTLRLLQALRDRKVPLPAAGVLISPYADIRKFVPHPHDFIVLEKAMRITEHVCKHRDGSAVKADSIDLSPAHYVSFKGLPPLLFWAGEYETLRAAVEVSAAKARKEGVETVYIEGKRGTHTIQAFGDWLPESDESLYDMAAFVRNKLLTV